MPLLSLGSVAPPFTIAPVFGQGLRSPGGRVLVGFIRHLGCPLGRLGLGDYSVLANAIEAAGVELVVLTDSPAALARDVVSRDHTLCALGLDPAGALRRAFGLGSVGPRRAKLGALLGHPAAFVQALALRYRVGDIDEGALPGAFGLEADGRVGFVWAPPRWDARPEGAALLRWARGG